MVARCLLIGVDGAQLEHIKALNLEHFSQLHTYMGYTGGVKSQWSQAETWSGPGWCTVLTGVWANRHGVRSNSSGAIDSDAPSIFSTIKTIKPDYKTASIISWGPINSQFLVNELDGIDYVPPPASDKQVTAAGVNCVQQGEYDFIFVQLSDVDYVGHDHGFGEQYNAALRTMDEQLGQLLDAVESRADEADDWLVLVTTDHGRSGSGHGGHTLQEKTVFVASNRALNTEASSPVPIEDLQNKEYDGLYGHVSHASIAPTVLSFLGIDSAEGHKMDGPSLWGDVGIRKLMFDTLHPPRLTWYGKGQEGDVQVFVNGKLRAQVAVNEEGWKDNTTEPGESPYDYTLIYNGISVSLRFGNLHEVRAALDWSAEKSFIFFQQRQLYSRYNWTSDRADPGYPALVTEKTWPGLTEYASQIITAFSRDAKTAYIFLDDGTYLRYSKEADRVESGPTPIDDDTWPGMNDYKMHVSAAVRWTGPYTYFFLKNGTYLRFNLDDNKVDTGYPKDIDDKNWLGLAPYRTQIRSAILASSRLAYIFLKGGRYLRFDVEADQASPAQPSLINDATWPGLLG